MIIHPRVLNSILEQLMQADIVFQRGGQSINMASMSRACLASSILQNFNTVDIVVVCTDI
jgi:hypothetical protein